MIAMPLISVIVPTYRRAPLLPRAIESALRFGGNSIEIIVVPNGQDETWKDSLKPWSGERWLRVSPIAPANVSAARNHGVAIARGEYLRFLDDDDYLLPASTAQVEFLNRTGADVCSGLLSNIDEDGIDSGVNTAPTGEDFVCAALELSGFRLPHGNLWRRTTVQACLWDTALREGEDYAWMLDVAATSERRWVKFDEPVGVWVQHRGARGSSVARPTNRQDGVLSHIFALHQKLDTMGRLTHNRRTAIANALWRYIHAGFPSHPVYWSRVAWKALAIDPDSRPPDRFYIDGPFRTLHPVLGEWTLLPVRVLTQRARDTSSLWRERDYRRRL